MIRPTRKRCIAAAISASAAISVVATGTSTLADNGSQPEGLRILLTNDDGWNAPGITAVFDALVAQGHDVAIVAPATNQSGVGGRITFGGSLVVAQPETDKYSVSGTPADATEFGLSNVFAGNAPDLVISGTNAGQNIGASTIHSGTVGAATTALNDGIPAIAVSTETGLPGTPLPFAETADFVVELVNAIQANARPNEGLLPTGVGLNVNYPIVEGGAEPSGVELTRTGVGFIDGNYDGPALPAVGTSSTYSVRIGLIPETLPDADTTALAANKIAITVISGNFDVEPRPGQIQQLVNALNH